MRVAGQACDGERGDDATAKAQDEMYEAWERTTSRSRIALARKALGISPLCADAYVLLAEEARSIEEAPGPVSRARSCSLATSAGPSPTTATCSS